MAGKGSQKSPPNDQSLKESIINQETIASIENTFAASSHGSIHFGQVVGQLIQAGVESYHVDYRGRRATCYMPNGEVHAIDTGAPEPQIAAAFSPEGLIAAIRGAQAGAVKYPEFKRLSQAAGCASYTVWIAGRHVTYFGRKGETHIEKFPD